MRKIFVLEDLDCANCANKMENAIKKIEGVEFASVSFITQRLTLEADENKFDEIIKMVVKTCKHIEPDCKVIL